MRILFTVCIFLSSFLLFLVQPIIAKEIMPWFGGTSAVWTTCLMFFQIVLLAGYTYSDAVTRWLKPRSLSILHVTLLAIAVATLPIIPREALKPDPAGAPIGQALLLLLATVGLPYFCLSTTGPLLQSWFSRFFPESKVYRLFALSNLASLVALIAYPFVIEPYSTTTQQAWWWSGGFCLFATLCAASAWVSKRYDKPSGIAPVATSTPEHATPDKTDTPDTPPSRLDYALWLTLSALGSMLLLAVSTHITLNIASIPLLWLLPLSIYLLTFVLCFDGSGWYRRSIFVGPLLLFPVLMAMGQNTKMQDINITVEVPLYVIGLFVCCMFYHGELSNRKPSARYLTRFYLALSSGGALGGILVSAIAPYVFNQYYELPIILVATSVLSILLLKDYLTANKAAYAIFMFAIVSGLTTTYTGWSYYKRESESNVLMLRNFYAASRVTDIDYTEEANKHLRLLYNGIIIHGTEVLPLEKDKKLIPNTYYGYSGGVGHAMRMFEDKPRRVGIIGLGVGTIAAYGRPGDYFRFYEINPQVKQIAEQEFDYLKQSPAPYDIVLGDARMMLESELKQGQPGNFDVLVVDAFSGESIPVHLITKEALNIYRQHVKPNGIIAFHVSNLFLNLPAVVKQLADDAGWKATYIIDLPKPPQSPSQWVLVSNNETLLHDPEVMKKSGPVRSIRNLSLWTDGYNNLFKILY